MPAPSDNNVRRFGVFEVDLTAGELRRNGVRVKLQEQPFQVLAALLERPGEIVSKEELKERIWSDDTFVDFDHSLSTAIGKVRSALGDSATRPHIIETVPKRGYRFLAYSQEQASLAASSRTRWLFAVSAGVVLLAAVAAFYFHDVSDPEQIRSEMPLTAVPVTTFPGFEYHAAISPDGGRVAYTRVTEGGAAEGRFAGDIYVQTIDSDEDPIKLTNSPGHDFNPTWSPEGNYLAFVRFTPGHSEIVRIPSIGGPETKLGELSIPAAFPAVFLVLKYLDWSADGEFLAVAQNAGQQSPGLYQLEIETGKQTPLSSAEVAFLADPAYAPDGRSLAYAGFQKTNTADIWLQDLDGSGSPAGEPRRLTRQESFINGLDWTADGREIVFSSSFEKAQRLWRVAIDGGQPPVLQNGGERGRSPSIAAHSNRLVYGRRQYDSNIWSLPGPLARNDSQTAPYRIVASTREDDSVHFSPDGTRIVFVSARTGNPELWTSAADGSDAKRITSWNGANLGSPRWSRDGVFIAFDGDRTGPLRDIYVVRADGGEVRRVTASDSADMRPAWSRDGAWIYFSSSREGQAAIWKAPAAGGEPIQVTGNAGFEFYEAPDESLYFHDTIDGQGDILRRPAGRGELERVVAGVASKSWTGFDSGICFVKEADGGPAGLWFYDFSTRQSERFAEFPEATSITGSPGLAVSPDGKQAVFSAIQGGPASDVMLLEGFH